MIPKFQSVDPARLRPNPWNTNHVSPENEAKLTESITQHGMFKPIVVREVDGGLEILGGEHRWIVSKNLGLKEVPIVNLGTISDDKAKKIGLIDNSRYGADDTISLAELLKDLGPSDTLQAFLPYTDADLTQIFSSVNIALDTLDLDAGEPESTSSDETKITPAPKTHTTMRFQVPVTDAERIADVIARTSKRQGFTTGSELQNAGDALVFLLVGSSQPEPEFPEGFDDDQV